MTDVDEFLFKVNREIDTALDALVPAADIEPARLHEAIRWSLFAGGKRIRPAIVFAAGETFGASVRCLLSTAAAVEMIHTYSLIHDDLPSMDNDDLRRGQPACHRKFGDATAILAGDVLQTLAYKAIADDESIPADARIKLIGVIASAAGTPDGMVAGQQLDLGAEGRDIAIEEIEQIHRRKTGAMISASAKAGAIIGGASDSELKVIGQYADCLGLLFQVTDDLLDITQATDTIGKTAGKDVSSKKATYPGHYGVDQTIVLADRLRDQSHNALSGLEKNTVMLRGLVDAILNRRR